MFKPSKNLVRIIAVVCVIAMLATVVLSAVVGMLEFLYVS